MSMDRTILRLYYDQMETRPNRCSIFVTLVFLNSPKEVLSTESKTAVKTPNGSHSTSSFLPMTSGFLFSRAELTMWQINTVGLFDFIANQNQALVFLTKQLSSKVNYKRSGFQ